MFLFGKKKETTSSPAAMPSGPPPAELLTTIQSLQKHIETLIKSQDMWEKKTADARNKAIAANKKGDKKVALQWMKRMKLYDAQSVKLIAMQDSTEAQIMALQSQVTNRDHLSAMTLGTMALEREQQTVNVEAMDRLRDKYEEVMDDHVAVDDAFKESWAPRSGVDEDDLLKELDGMMEGDMTAELTATPSAVPAMGAGDAVSAGAGTTALPEFPDAPTGAIKVPAKPVATPAGSDMEAELAALAAMV